MDSEEFRDRIGLERPVVQAGMGGGLAGAELAAAVSRAGGLGTVGIVPDVDCFEAELRRARALAPGRPVAANLLLPFTRPRHVAACLAARVDLVVVFCGSAPRAVAALREAGIVVLAQVGTVQQARRALLDGVDGLVSQGLQAGGHLLGERPLLEALSDMLDLAAGRPVLAAGGMHTARTVREALDAGAVAAVAGTRFLLSDESRAHPAYKRRALAATRTLDTRLFSVGWSDRHRVLPNAATDRWCAQDENGPWPVLATNRVAAPLLRRLPAGALTLATRFQQSAIPFYGPTAPLAGMDDRSLEVMPLYAGTCAASIDRVVSAAECVRMLDPADGLVVDPLANSSGAA